MSTTIIRTFHNIGRIDAAIRSSIALALLGLVLSRDLSPASSFALVALSIPTMLLALLRWDPLYSLLGFSTSKDRFHA